jgi:phage gp36-like protein
MGGDLTTLYADTADLQAVLDGTDSGTGTAAQLTDNQLTLALTAASNRVSVYVGQVYDSSTPEAVPPDILHDITLDLAAFFATTSYYKNKTIASTHPVWLRYQSAMQILNDVRDGKVRLDIFPADDTDSEQPPQVTNRIPRIFNHEDSNTRLNPVTGGLEADSPYWTNNWLGLEQGGGPVYQG